MSAMKSGLGPGYRVRGGGSGSALRGAIGIGAWRPRCLRSECLPDTWGWRVSIETSWQVASRHSRGLSGGSCGFGIGCEPICEGPSLALPVSSSAGGGVAGATGELRSRSGNIGDASGEDGIRSDHIGDACGDVDGIGSGGKPEAWAPPTRGGRVAQRPAPVSGLFRPRPPRAQADAIVRPEPGFANSSLLARCSRLIRSSRRTARLRWLRPPSTCPCACTCNYVALQCVGMG